MPKLMRSRSASLRARSLASSFLSRVKDFSRSLAGGLPIDVEEGLNVSEGIGIRVARAEDSAQGGVAVKKAREMLTYEELLRRP
eukprot:4504489-Pleurochrysis_carterae.AAC.1